MYTSLLQRIRGFAKGIFLILCLGIGHYSQAQTTTLSFNGIANGSFLTTQYQSEGVTVSGATIYYANNTSWTDTEGANVAVSPAGLMIFTFSSAVLGNVISVSSYISGNVGVGLYAYDASGNLLTQANLASTAYNQLLTVTSTTPIASIEIHDNGSSFAVDNMTIVTQPACVALTSQLYTLVEALPDTDFESDFDSGCGFDRDRAQEHDREIVRQRDHILDRITRFEDLMKKSTVKQKHLLEVLDEIKWHVDRRIKTGTDRTKLLDLIEEIMSATTAGSC